MSKRAKAALLATTLFFFATSFAFGLAAIWTTGTLSDHLAGTAGLLFVPGFFAGLASIVVISS